MWLFCHSMEKLKPQLFIGNIAKGNVVIQGTLVYYLFSY